MVGDEEYHNECDVLNTEIIKKLVAETPDDKIKDTILLYDVKKEGKIIKKDFLAVDTKDLLSTCEFFSVPNAKNFKTKSTLVTKLMQAIENLLMAKCGDCTQYYSVEYGNKPSLACRKCGQGAHAQCYDEHVAKAGITLVYTCFLCSNGNQNTGDIPVPNSQPQNSQQSQPRVAELNEESNESESQEVDPEEDEDNELKYEITDKTCKYFLKTRCRHGIRGTKCKYDHLPVCNKLMRNGLKGPYGCKRGKDCQFYHPHMCRESLQSKTCSRTYCKYNHVRGTFKSENNYQQQSTEDEYAHYHQTEASQSPPGVENPFLGALQQLQQQVMLIQQQLASKPKETQPIQQQFQSAQPAQTRSQPVPPQMAVYPQQQPLQYRQMMQFPTLQAPHPIQGVQQRLVTHPA